MSSRGGVRCRKESGAVLLIILLFVFMATLVSATLISSAQTQAQREKEEQLLFVGDQYRRAISSYYALVPPGGVRMLPKTLDDLINDRRFPTPVHHLRRIYVDPMTGRSDWTLITALGGFVGVASTSTAAPLKKVGFDPIYVRFGLAQTYGDWAFSVNITQ